MAGSSKIIALAILGGGGYWAYLNRDKLGLPGSLDATKPPGTSGGPAGPPAPPARADPSVYPSDPDYDPGRDPTLLRPPTGAVITSEWQDLGVGGVAPGLAWSTRDGLVYNIDGAVQLGGPFTSLYEAQNFGRNWLGLGDWTPGVE